MDDNGNSTKSEYELLRLRNMKALEEFVADDENDEELATAIAEINALTATLQGIRPAPTPRRRQQTRADPSFSFQGQIPTERRRSARLANIPAELNQFTEATEAEIVKRPPIKRRRSSRRSSRATPVVILPVECVTSELLSNIAVSSTGKQHSPDGTTCHQCRQKTLDTKTVCRSGECNGIRGYFCGPCLRNRYGEQVAVALLDPKWSCPACRGLCNCSFCQIARGQAPTGILAPIALQRGYQSVSHLLQDLQRQGLLPNGEQMETEDEEEKEDDGDSQQEDEEGEADGNSQQEDDERFLLGFNDKGEYVLQ